MENFFTLKELRKLIWRTWISFIFVGFVVYFSVNPIRWWGLVFAGIVLLISLINFRVKQKRIPISKRHPIPFIITIFPAVFLAMFSFALLKLDLALAFTVVAIGDVLCIPPEWDYSWVSYDRKDYGNR